MRSAPTTTEALLWQALSGSQLGVGFRRQLVIGTFIVDFAAPAARLVVEVDGGYHLERARADARRDRELGRLGWRVLRLPAELVRDRLGQGENALLRTRVPVNRFPEYVGELVRSLRALQPALGKVRIADMLARAGLHLSPTTARRMLDRQRPAPEPEPPIEVAPAQSATAPKEEKVRRVTARYPHHVWNIDITLLPRTGWWVPWPPQALPQRAPFCAWLVVVLDHFSRSVVGWKLFDKEPTAAEVHSVLDQARRATKATPKYTISDQGVQFRDEYKAWCKRRGVRPRFGAVGEHGSIAVLERFFRSLKTEMLRRLPWVPMSKKRLTEEVAAYMGWYDLHRPHRGLCGRTPCELRTGTKPARGRRLEPRPAYPIDQRRDLPKGRRVKGELVVVVDHFEGRSHLPIVSLREAA
ncbi:MAG: DUF559 domain-containing protein [Myxococcales bacterium]|nr:DUF559 domain-containing protein [Myxococcales bacterium]